MRHQMIITQTELEQARQAFVVAWAARDKEPVGLPGERTRAGLINALLTLGIEVDK